MLSDKEMEGVSWVIIGFSYLISGLLILISMDHIATLSGVTNMASLSVLLQYGMPLYGILCDVLVLVGIITLIQGKISKEAEHATR